MTNKLFESMWVEACSMLADAERMQRELFRPRSVNGPRPVWRAPADVVQHGSDLHVWIALPGVAPERIEVALDGANLHVRGDRSRDSLPLNAQIRRQEIPYGRFERHVDLPAADYRVRAIESVHGCVRLWLCRS